jgi:hypothetical protein
MKMIIIQLSDFSIKNFKIKQKRSLKKIGLKSKIIFKDLKNGLMRENYITK